MTGSKLDVQYKDLNAQYPFGFAAFDNAQVRHAVHFDAKYLELLRYRLLSEHVLQARKRRKGRCRAGT